MVSNNKTKAKMCSVAMIKKLKANTLPEVLIAIVIISFTSALGVSIYLNIQDNTQPFLKLKANEIAQRVLIESETNQDFFDNNFKEEEFTVNKTISKPELYPDCIIIRVKISNKTDKKICEIQKLIHVE